MQSILRMVYHLAASVVQTILLGFALLIVVGIYQPRISLLTQHASCWPPA